MYDLTYRPRRLRINPEMRDLVRETTLDVTDLIYPLFIVPGEGIKKKSIHCQVNITYPLMKL